MHNNDATLTFSVDEAAILLGIGRNQAYLAVSNGQIPSIRIGRSIRIPKQQLDELLTKKVEQSKAEVTQNPATKPTEIPTILRMAKRGLPKVPSLFINLKIPIELNNKLVQSATFQNITLSEEIRRRLERTFIEATQPSREDKA